MDPPIEFAFDNPKFCDCTLVLKSNNQVHKSIHVSKLILSSHSQYFIALFTNDMKETNQKEIEIELSSNESALFYSIIKSLYTGELILPSLSELSFEFEKAVQRIEKEQTQNKKQEKNDQNGKEKEDKGKKNKTNDEIEEEEEGEGDGKKQKEENGEKETNDEKEKEESKQSEKKREEGESGSESEEEEKDEGENDDEEKEGKKEKDQFPVKTEEFKRVRVYLDTIKLLDRFSIQKRFSHCIDLLKKESNSIQSACYHLLILDDSFQHIAEIQEYKKMLVDFLVKEYVNFDKLWREKEFLLLPNIALKSVLERDDLNVSCEETVLQALRKWINHNPNKRMRYLPELMELVKFAQIDTDYLLEYVLGYNNFFNFNGDFVEVFDLFQDYLNGAIRYLNYSRNNLQRKELGCFSDGGFPENWLKKRAGYKASETSDTVDWECECNFDFEEKVQWSRVVYFRGVFYHFKLELIVAHNKYIFCIVPIRLLTSGMDDPRPTNVSLRYTLTAFNYQTNTRDYIKLDQMMSGVNIGTEVIQKLKLREDSSPYIKPNNGSKKVVHLFASVKTMQVS